MEGIKHPFTSRSSMYTDTIHTNISMKPVHMYMDVPEKHSSLKRLHIVAETDIKLKKISGFIKKKSYSRYVNLKFYLPQKYNNTITIEF